MSTKTETGAREIDARDVAATRRAGHKRTKNRFDKLEDEATVELRIHIELEEDAFVRSSIEDSDLTIAATLN